MPFPEICLNNKQHRPNEWPTLRFQQRTCGSQDVYLRTSDEIPLELDDEKHVVQIIAADHIFRTKYIVCKEGEIIDGSDGHVRFTLNECELESRGLYLAEISVYDKEKLSCYCDEEDVTSSGSSSSSVPCDQAARIYKYRSYLEIEQDITDVNQPFIGVSIAEIRLAMRDLSSEDNFLLDDVEFTDTEIAWAMRRPVDYWNERPPRLRGQTFTPANFPYRYEWINAVKGELMIMAAQNYRRNHLQYSAAGLSVDDQNKFQQYENVGKQLLADWKEWVEREKVSLNFQRSFNATRLRSFDNYPYGGGYR
jgi:hypothetical protein